MESGFFQATDFLNSLLSELVRMFVLSQKKGNSLQTISEMVEAYNNAPFFHGHSLFIYIIYQY